MRKNNHPVTWDLWLAKDWACSPATAYQLLKVVSWPDLANTTDKLWPIMLQLTIQGRKWLLRGNLKFLADGVYKRKKRVDEFCVYTKKWWRVHYSPDSRQTPGAFLSGHIFIKYFNQPRAEQKSPAGRRLISSLTAAGGQEQSAEAAVASVLWNKPCAWREGRHW